VRFLDNFSAGNRGAASTECVVVAPVSHHVAARRLQGVLPGVCLRHLLQHGYKVVFLHRAQSAQPWEVRLALLTVS
jgi:hypothetical protein